MVLLLMSMCPTSTLRLFLLLRKKEELISKWAGRSLYHDLKLKIIRQLKKKKIPSLLVQTIIASKTDCSEMRMVAST